MASAAGEVESVKEDPPSQGIKVQLDPEDIKIKEIYPVVKVENAATDTSFFQSDGDLAPDFFDDFYNVKFLAGFDVVASCEKQGQSPTESNAQPVPDLLPELTSNGPSVSTQDCSEENNDNSKQIEMDMPESTETAKLFETSGWNGAQQSTSCNSSNASGRKRSLPQQRNHEIKEKLCAQTHADHNRSTILSTPPYPLHRMPSPPMHPLIPNYPPPNMPCDQSYHVPRVINPYAASMYNTPIPCAAFYPYQRHEPVYTQTQVLPLSEQSIGNVFNYPNISHTECSRTTNSPPGAQRCSSCNRSNAYGSSLPEQRNQEITEYLCAQTHADYNRSTILSTPHPLHPMPPPLMNPLNPNYPPPNMPCHQLYQVPRVINPYEYSRTTKRPTDTAQQLDSNEREKVISRTQDAEMDELHCADCINRKNKRFVDVAIQCNPELLPQEGRGDVFSRLGRFPARSRVLLPNPQNTHKRGWQSSSGSKY